MHIAIEWSEPEAARDIVDAAVKNFQDSRYGIEVGVLPEKVKILDANMQRSRGEFDRAFQDLQNRMNPDCAKDREKNGLHHAPGTSARRRESG